MSVQRSSIKFLSWFVRSGSCQINRVLTCNLDLLSGFEFGTNPESGAYSVNVLGTRLRLPPRYYPNQYNTDKKQI